METFIRKIFSLENKVKVSDLEITGQKNGHDVNVKCTNFRFGVSSRDENVTFSVHVRVDGVLASRWDMCDSEDQKQFCKEWSNLIRGLNVEEYNRRDDKRENAENIWKHI